MNDTLKLPEAPLGPQEKAILDDCLRIIDHLEPMAQDLHDCGIDCKDRLNTLDACRQSVLKLLDKRRLWR